MLDQSIKDGVYLVLYKGNKYIAIYNTNPSAAIDGKTGWDLGMDVGRVNMPDKIIREL